MFPLSSANLVLQDTIERIYVGDAYGDIPRGIFIIRGENVVLLGEIVSSPSASVELCFSNSKIIKHIPASVLTITPFDHDIGPGQGGRITTQRSPCRRNLAGAEGRNGSTGQARQGQEQVFERAGILGRQCRIWRTLLVEPFFFGSIHRHRYNNTKTHGRTPQVSCL